MHSIQTTKPLARIRLNVNESSVRIGGGQKLTCASQDGKMDATAWGGHANLANTYQITCPQWQKNRPNLSGTIVIFDS